jgi:hypothetical protein
MQTKKLENYGTPSLVELGREYGGSKPADDNSELSEAQQTWQEAILALSGQPANFDADNLLTNEWSTAQPLDVLWNDAGEPNGTYIGIGAFQNFTYASALNVEQALILDIRPANIAYFLFMIDLLQRCPTPDAFISHLFCRPDCQAQTGPWTTIPSIKEVAAFVQGLRESSFDRDYMEAQISRTKALARLLIDSRFASYISAGWAASFMRLCVEYFARFGTELTYLTWGLGITDRHPTMAHLVQTRSPILGRPTFFLSPVHYQRIRDLAINWQIIPIIGDLRDPQLASRFSSWSGQVGPVRGLYTSNVENYLVTRGSWTSYQDYINTLKRFQLAEDAVIIKAFFQYDAKRHPLQVEDYHDCVFVHRVSDLVRMHDEGKLNESEDIYLKVPFVSSVQ